MRCLETVHGIFLDDLDAIGVLHNARYLLMFERALGAFWRHLGWRRMLDYESNPDRLQVVRENRVEYLRPVKAVDEVRIHTWIGKLGRTSMSFRFRMLPTDGDAPFAEGTRVVVKVDLGSRRPAPWSNGLRDLVSPWVIGDESKAATELSIERFGANGPAPCPTIE